MAGILNTNQFVNNNTLPNPSNIEIPSHLDGIFEKMTTMGSLDRAVSNTLYGFNHRQTPHLIPINKDAQGFTFMVRPQLNLSSVNIRYYRWFYDLLTTKELSFQRYVRNILDPRLAYNLYTDTMEKLAASESSTVETTKNSGTRLVDNENPFIPVITNTLTTISGWPDITVPTFTSSPGRLKEQYSQVDGTVHNYEQYDVNITFRNMIGSPIIYMVYIWLHYMSAVFLDKLWPYGDFIAENEIDYMTRIYRITLSRNKRYVTNISACGVAFPLSVPTGQIFDGSSDKTYTGANAQFTIRFRCLGFMPFDPILIKEFNDTVNIFNSSMADLNNNPAYDNNTTITEDLAKVPLELLQTFNFRGYPRINPDTMELEWWVKKKMIESFLDPQPLDNNGILTDYSNVV